ncbi:high frequency lysogenization protein HflD [Ferrimonas balearica]|uniref:high frequency lysogenization protein HflD n=1 Tax=Ferrimonas balearica TaxID=44012 RepID=UPI001C9A03FC|nr:high frequency lysogenization protein HflD [Ferrimonas balearica]MBY5920317.1 high frequency lysogenization protein HflD [Ferrimonas balearica]MBY5996998.1 high frequency lysogenization protein HflD [Ferrimonas balearica]
MRQSLSQSNMAFAGLCLAVHQVRELSRFGRVDEELLGATLNTVLVTDPDSAEDVYQGCDLRLGYQTLVDQLGDGNKKDVDLTRYVVGILALERKLSSKPAALSMLAERLSQVKRQRHHYEVTDEQVLSNMASVYSDVISPLGARIQVVGSPAQLQQPLNQYRIRALLLAAIRSAVLWRQLGGKRRQLVLSRRAMVKDATQALQHL